MVDTLKQLDVFRVRLNGVDVRIDLYPTAQNGQPAWRLLRLHHLLGYLAAIAPEALLELRALSDDNGYLVVEWFNDPHPNFRAAVAVAWSSQICDEKTDRIKHVVT